MVMKPIENREEGWQEILAQLKDGRMLDHPGLNAHLRRAQATGDYARLEKFLKNNPTILAMARRNIQLAQHQALLHPFRPYPRPDEVAEYLNGELSLGWLNEFDDQLVIPVDDLCKILICLGAVGSGKSVFLKNLIKNALALRKRGFNLLVFDREKREYAFFARYNPGLAVIPRERLLINPLQRNPYLSLREHILVVTEVLVSEAYLGALSRNLIKVCLGVLYQNFEQPNLYDLLNAIRHMRIHEGRNSYRLYDLLWSIENRLEALLESGLFNCRQGIPIEVFEEEDLVIELEGHQDMVVNFITSFLVRSLYRANVKRGLTDATLRTLFIIEEARGLLQAERNISDFGDSAFNQDLSRIRAAGLGTVIATQEPRSVSPSLRALAATKVAFRLSDGDDLDFVQKGWRLNDEQTDHILDLPKYGQAIVRYSGFPKPFILAIPPVEADYSVTDDELARLMEDLWAELDKHIKTDPEPTIRESDLKARMSWVAQYLLYHLGHFPFTKNSDLKNLSTLTQSKAKRAVEELISLGLVKLEKYRTRGTSKATYTVLTQKAWDLLAIPGPQGRGSYEHQLYQDVVRRYCQAQGWRSKVEGILKGSNKAMDILAHDPERGWLAFEITLSMKNLISNILQDFRAGVVEITIVTRDVGDQRKARHTVSQHPALNPYLRNIFYQVISDFGLPEA